MLVARSTSRRRQRALSLLALAALLWPLLAWAAARALIVQAERPRADALVVLAGSAAYVERTQLAAQLYREGRAPVVVLTNDNERGGWSSAEQRNPFFVERAIAELVANGVPRARIEVLAQPVASTYDEACALRDYTAAHNLHALLFVTSAYHSRRALWTLRRVFAASGVELGLMSVAPGRQTPTPAGWWWHRQGWQIVGGEYVKLLYYHWHY